MEPADTTEAPDSTKHEHTRIGMSIEALKRAFHDNLFYLQGRYYDVATDNDKYMAAAYTVRERLLDRWIKSAQRYKASTARTVCYLSAEYLPGPHLENNLINLGIMDKARQAAVEMDLDIEKILEQEEEPGLGNGGLGRLAACYMDSLATLEIPAIGYGIRYEFGIFNQHMEDGWQVEKTDAWLHNGNPWEIARPKLRFPVGFGGHSETYHDKDDARHIRWRPEQVVYGVAYDTPIVGYGVDNVNLLRLWSAEASESFDFHAFNSGDYYRAVKAKVSAETLSKILYPNDEPEVGKELRLKQQYFFASCSLQDMIRLQLGIGGTLEKFHDKFTVQLNDTHPAIAVAELVRLLVDEYCMEWDKAWKITRHTFAYTNHTLLPEALETWSLKIFKRLLPRHLEIVYKINSNFLDQVRMHFINDVERLARMSIINEQNGGEIRMAHLACAGSYAVNGVAELHTELLKTTVMRDFYELWPAKFSNKTNGVSPRRFMVVSNPRLSRLLDETIGEDWVRDLDQLKNLEQFAEDRNFQQHWQQTKLEAKRELAALIRRRTEIAVNPESMFDIQVKRIHEYKRQHLNILHIIALYERIKQNPNIEIPPRTFIFGGKAAPGYYMAKLIIKLITSVGRMVDRDEELRERIKVVFFPNFNVKNAQHIYPAADLSEQISTAGKEASGTGNMKFAMNGALTIGTMDGANIEIREAVGKENFFLFGMTSEQVQDTLNKGYNPMDYYHGDDELRSAIDLISSGFFSHGDTELFRPLVDHWLQKDAFMALADFTTYRDCQDMVGNAFGNPENWTRMSILNVARIGKFSSDRAIREYCDEIWNVSSCSEEACPSAEI